MSEHSLWKIWNDNRIRMWCSECARFDCDGRKVATWPKVDGGSKVLGKVRLARLKELSAGRDGTYVIELSPGRWVARRGRQFFDRRRMRKPGAVQPQYLRERSMYSVNSASTLQLHEAKRWKSRQAAAKANRPLRGKVVNLVTTQQVSIP